MGLICIENLLSNHVDKILMAEDVQKKVRGSVIKGYLDFVRKVWGQQGFDRCLNALQIKDDFYEGHFKEKNFYPHQILNDIILWIHEEKGMDYVRRAGKHTAMDLGILKFIFQFVSFNHLITRGPKEIKHAYTYGEVKVNRTETGAEILFYDLSEIPENCAGWLGALQGLMEVTKTKGTVEKTACQLEGAPACKYVITLDN